MKTTRLLLPFTHGVEMQPLEVALRFAHSHDAILVPLVLLQVSAETRAPHIRPEMIQQSHDFFEALRYKAKRHGVEVEHFVVTATNIVEKITVFANMKECAGILLFARDGKGLLLQTQQIQEMIGRAGMPPRYLIHLPAKQRPPYRQRAIQWLFRLDRRHGHPQGDAPTNEHQSVPQLEPINRPMEHTSIF